MRDVDAAKISVLDAANALFAFPRIGPIRGWRPVVYPGDEGTFVRMYGATSKYQTGHIVTTSTDMPGDDLAEAIVVSIHSEEGDSGAAIVDRENLVLGFLVGRNTSTADHLRIFCPASPVLDRLSCDIPTQS
jgi:hypothetical protein